MEPVYAPSIPLAPPGSPLHTLLTNFFDPRHTLHSIAHSLGLTLEGLLYYIAIPEVADALDEAEALIHRRSVEHANAAIESVDAQLRALPPRPAAPSRSQSDRHPENLETTGRAAELPRVPLAPRGEQSQRATRRAPSRAATAEPRSNTHRSAPSIRGRTRPLDGDAALGNPPTTSLRPSASAAPLRSAGRARTSIARAPFTFRQQRARRRLVSRGRPLCRRTPALLGTPYTHGRCG